MYRLIAAFGTDADKLQLIGCDNTAGCRFLQNGCRKNYFIQVCHLPADGADKVRMGICVDVIAFQPIDNTDGLDDAFLFEHGDVPIDGTKAQVGEVWLQLLIDPFGGGVALGSADTIQNGVPLFTVFP